ncbi:MAG: glycosyltransferase [Bacteroidetes bacterium]|nr:glycosyltransferase [Bacteroidota bacterium]
MQKVLIITYYWPPSGGVGVQRWLKFSKYLPENGWVPIIYTPSNPDFELTDLSLLNEVPQDFEILQSPIYELFSFYRKIFGGGKASTRQGIVSEKKQSSPIEKIVIWIRGNFFIPDPRVWWVRPSVRFLKNYIKKNPVDVIVTTGPPHSMHLIGLGLKNKFGIKWIADFRDPWSEWDVLPRLKVTRRSMSKHMKLERQVLSGCDLVLTVSPRLAETFRPHAKRVGVITNGFDQRPTNVEKIKPDRFRICHVGLLNETRNPEVLWQVLNDLCNEEEGFTDDLEIILAGNVSSYVIEKLMSGTLARNVVNHGFIPHSDVFDLYQNSYILLLLLNQTDNAKWIIPAKLFEYLQTGRYILPLGPLESDANDILKAIELNSFVEFNDYNQIKNRLIDLYMKYKNNDLPEPIKGIKQFTRRQLTADLATLLNEIIAEG